MRAIGQIVRCVFYSVRLSLETGQTIFDLLNTTNEFIIRGASPPGQIKRAFNLTHTVGLQRQYGAGCIS